jgi:hypothetical protein
LKKDLKFEWTPGTQKDFTEIKHVVITTHVLISLDFEKYFILYAFALEETLSSILTQKNEKA